MKTILISSLCLICFNAFTQTNTFPTSGNTGIGTVSPAEKLHLKGNLRIDGVSGFTHSELVFYRADGSKFASIGQGDLAASNSTFDIKHFNGNDIRFMQAGFEAVRIMAGGNVGIGTSNPTAKLEINQMGGVTGQYQGLKISAGNSFNYFGNSQVLFSYGASGYAHAIKSRHMDSGTAGNAIDFYLWQPGDPVNGVGSLHAMTLNGGNMGIGTTNPDAKLAVKGTVHAQEVKVDLNVPGPDYVFEPTYTLPTLAEVETYILENKHLPEIPAAKEMEQNGINVGEMNMLLLKKVEELTLYLIEVKKDIALLQEENRKLKKTENR